MRDTFDWLPVHSTRCKLLRGRPSGFAQPPRPVSELLLDATLSELFPKWEYSRADGVEWLPVRRRGAIPRRQSYA